MVFYVIIRGPLACGKTTVSKELAKKLKAKHISIDKILDKYDLGKDREEGYTSQKSFIKANQIAVKDAKNILDKGKIVIFDGNFYWKSQVEDLINRLNYPHYVFTLKAPLEVCIRRDKERGKTHGADAARVVHKKVSEFDYGRSVDVTQSFSKVTKEIISILPIKKLSEIIRKKPFNLKIENIAPISSNNAMSGE